LQVAGQGWAVPWRARRRGRARVVHGRWKDRARRQRRSVRPWSDRGPQGQRLPCRLALRLSHRGTVRGRQRKRQARGAAAVRFQRLQALSLRYIVLAIAWLVAPLEAARGQEKVSIPSLTPDILRAFLQ